MPFFTKSWEEPIFFAHSHETIIDQLKNISQIEHSRHRSPVNCFVNILGGLIAYCHQPKKPSIAINHNLLLPA
jgi:hypothetical protein